MESGPFSSCYLGSVFVSKTNTCGTNSEALFPLQTICNKHLIKRKTTFQFTRGYPLGRHTFKKSLLQTFQPAFHFWPLLFASKHFGRRLLTLTVYSPLWNKLFLRFQFLFCRVTHASIPETISDYSSVVQNLTRGKVNFGSNHHSQTTICLTITRDYPTLFPKQ